MMSYNDYEYARMLVGCTPFIVAPRRDKTENIPKIKNVIFNKPATIVFWEDGTKTVVKAIDEPFDEEKGLAMAIAKKALEKGITEVVFDRGGYIYHGKVQALADAAREAGLQF